MCQPFSVKVTLVTFEEQESIEEDGYTINIVPATEWLLNLSVL